MSLSPSYDRFVSLQKGVVSEGSDKCRFRCPCHEDHNPSAGAAIGENGLVIAHCHGCGASLIDMIHAVNSTKAAIFGDDRPKVERKEPFKKGSFGLLKQAIAFYEKKIGPITAKYEYKVGGKTVGWVARFDPPGKDKEFRPIWKDGNGWIVSAPKENRPLYRGDEIKDGDTVYVTEGEKACDAARSIGLVAVSPMNGAKSPHKTDWSKVKGHDVVILRDNDDAGLQFAEKVASLCLEAGACP